MNFNILSSLIIVMSVLSCSTNNETAKSNSPITGSDTMNANMREKAELELVPAEVSPVYQNASLELGKLEITEDNGKYRGDFQFEVGNYDLKVQTEFAEARGVLNDERGQYIQLNIDNRIFKVSRNKTSKLALPVGEHILFATLNKSFHQSVKNQNAFVLKKFTIGTPTSDDDKRFGRFKDFDASSPHLFFNLPKQTYSQKESEKILLDFHLLNTTLSKKGNRVRVIINKNKRFTLNEWRSVYLLNAPIGEMSIRMTLIDEKGNAIPGPFNNVIRKIKIEP